MELIAAAVTLLAVGRAVAGVAAEVLPAEASPAGAAALVAAGPARELVIYETG